MTARGLTTAVLIGLDLGTARFKALGLRLDGCELAQVEQPTPWSQDGRHVELDPGAVTQLVRQTVAAVALQAARIAGGAIEVAGVGVTGMGEAGVLVDDRGRPLEPILAWHDPRGEAELVRREVGEEAFEASVGMRLTAQPSLAKILWLERNGGRASAAVRFLSLPEWAVVALGGEPVSELSLASRTGLLDVAAAAPFAGAAALLGRNLLARLIVAGEPAGAAGGDWVPSSVRGAALTVAGHDHQAAALAVGAAAPGALLDSLGTAEALVRCVEGPLPPDVVARLVARGASAGWGVVRGRSTVISGMRTGMVLERVAAALGATDRVARRRLGEEALDADPARLPDGVLVADPDLGLTPGPLVHQRAPAAVWAAAVRDVTAVSARRLERIADDLGPHHRLTLAGGWARNAAVVAEKRRQLGPLDVSDLREAGATGAALLAGVAAGLLEPPDRDPSPVWSRRGVLSAESQC